MGAHQCSNRAMPHTTHHEPACRPALTTQEVADYLGVSTQTVRRWRHDNLIAGRRVGHEIRFARTEVQRFAIARFGYLAAVL